MFSVVNEAWFLDWATSLNTVYVNCCFSYHDDMKIKNFRERKNYGMGKFSFNFPSTYALRTLDLVDLVETSSSLSSKYSLKAPVENW